MDKRIWIPLVEIMESIKTPIGLKRLSYKNWGVISQCLRQRTRDLSGIVCIDLLFVKTPKARFKNDRMMGIFITLIASGMIGFRGFSL